MDFPSFFFRLKFLGLGGSYVVPYLGFHFLSSDRWYFVVCQFIILITCIVIGWLEISFVCQDKCNTTFYSDWWLFFSTKNTCFYLFYSGKDEISFLKLGLTLTMILCFGLSGMCQNSWFFHASLTVRVIANLLIYF